MEQSHKGDVCGGFSMPGNISYLIIGNGIAGVTAAEILRNEDSAADITVIADDPFPVYYRPALKDYLAGRVREDKLWARPNSFYQDHRIRFLSDRVVGIQVGQHTIQMQSGREGAYDRLLLTNGARAIRLTCPGTDLVGVTTLRTVADYQAVVSRLGTARRIAVSGSGTLALETIETLRHRSYQVTHLLRRRTLWSEVLDTTASDLVLQQERRDGVDVRLEEEVAEIMGKNGEVSGVITTSGARIPCEMLIIAIGVEPMIDFIKSSGIPCGRGVQVDSAMRTSAPDIYAAGDILETTDILTRRTRVIGQWYPAIQQARAAAYSMLDLLDTSNPFHSSTFYNATFLYGLDFASIGLTQLPKDTKGYQEIIADPLPCIYRKVILKDGVPVGMLSLGNRKDALAFKRAIDHKVNLSTVASQLFTGDFKLNDWLDREGVPPPLLGASRKGAVAVRQVAYAGGTTAGAIIMKPQPAMEALLIPIADKAQAQQREMPQQFSQEEIVLSQTKVMTVGRQVGAYLLIDNDSVSRRHAEISYANKQYVLRDLGSSNGTYVNEVRLETDKVYILKPDDRVRFGKVKFRFQVQGAKQAEGIMTRLRSETPPGITKLHELTTGFYDPGRRDKSGPYAPSRQPVLNADGSLLLPGATNALPADIVATFKEAPALIVIVYGSPQVVQLKQGGRIMLGRDKACNVVLADVAASRRHAEVFPGPDGFYIRDLGSANGVIVNQMKIDNPYLLVHGDRIEIGGTVIFFMNIRQEERVGAVVGVGQSVPVQGRNGVILSEAKDLPNVPCRNCGASNISIARFCTICGTSLENPDAVIEG
jgi:NADPH-dependent 2,4-dienoyl-CoA reductase/sulfur reductase-like enzyme/pSer/pThr/pTyr-binding forkhead associated (FHA) protein